MSWHEENGGQKKETDKSNWMSLFELMPHAIATMNSRLSVSFANGNMCRWLDIQGGDDNPVGKTVNQVLPSGGANLDKRCRELLNDPDLSFTSETIRIDGGDVVTVHIYPVPGNDDNLKLLLMVQQPNISGRKISPNNNDLYKLANNISDIVFIVDMEGAIVYISPGIEQYGYSPRDVIFHPVFEYIHPDDLKLVRRKFVEAKSGRSRGSVPFRLRRNEGGFEWLEVNSSGQYDSKGNLVGMSGTLRNIKERMELEQIRSRAARLESLELMAGGIAHDFNNLLTSILGSISLATEQNRDSRKTCEILGEAEKAVMRAETLIRQLLSFARGGTLSRKPSDLGSIIKDSVSLSLLGANIKSTIHIARDLPQVNVDEGQIGQVLSNLVINAKQAMSEGGLLDVSASEIELFDGDVPTLEAGRYVVVNVADNGEGISEENQDKIFDPYFTTKAEGTGLGLATVFSIISRHEGMVTVNSELGRGTVFSIYLPVADEDNGVSNDIDEEAVAQGPQGKILVMDDEIEIRSICCSLLERMGHCAVSCKNGEEVLELFDRAASEEEPFDLLVLDLNIPSGMGGLATLDRLREKYPDIKAIVSSGYSDDPVMSDHKRYGFAGIVPKPYNYQMMKTAVDELLDR